MNYDKELQELRRRKKDLLEEYQKAKESLNALDYQECFQVLYGIALQFHAGDGGDKAIYLLAQIHTACSGIDQLQQVILSYENLEAQQESLMRVRDGRNN